MPEHVHLLVSEPPEAPLSRAIQSLKQSVSRRLALRAEEPFWQARYHDFNVWSSTKRIEKLGYMHRNPVKRGLATHPHHWLRSSFRHYATRRGGNGRDRIAVDVSQKRADGNHAAGENTRGAEYPAKQSLAGAPLSAEMGVKCWAGPPALAFDL